MSDQIQNATPAEADFIQLVAAKGFAPVIEDCHGCGHVRLLDGNGFCRSYANPAAKWSLGMCNFATHKRIEKTKDDHKVNPLKASKRGAG